MINMAAPPGGLKIFVRANNDLTISTKEICKNKSNGNNCLPVDGNQVKSFYEELVGLHEGETTSTCSSSGMLCDSSSGGIQKHRQRRKKRTRGKNPSSSIVMTDHDNRLSQLDPGSMDIEKCSTKQLRTQSGFLKAAQNGDVKLVREFLSGELNVNCRDGFGWTALMCASHSGHVPVVQMLLEAGADLGLRDSMGRTAVKMAALAKQSKIFNLLTTHGPEHHEHAEVESTADVGPAELDKETFYCNTCKKEFTDTTVKKHKTSTLHLFNCKLKPKPTTYFIPENNKGYQLLLKSGWNEEKGLGPGGQGKKFPVATVLKRDRKGLGKPAEKRAKVTHFGPGEMKAVANSRPGTDRQLRKTTINKRAQAKQLTKEKAKERQFRLEFYGM